MMVITKDQSHRNRMPSTREQETARLKALLLTLAFLAAFSFGVILGETIGRGNAGCYRQVIESVK